MPSYTAAAVANSEAATSRWHLHLHCYWQHLQLLLPVSCQMSCQLELGATAANSSLCLRSLMAHGTLHSASTIIAWCQQLPSCQ